MKRETLTNRLRVFDREDISDDVLFSYQMTKQHVVRTISQYVADSEYPLRGRLECLLNFKAIGQCRSERLLTHDMESKRSNRSDDFGMVFIANADEDSIDTWGTWNSRFFILSSLLLEFDELLPSLELLFW